MPEVDRRREDFQNDFSGGENSVSYKTLIRDSEVSAAENLLLRRGGGLTARGGYKDLGALLSSSAGRAIFEIEQRTPSVVVFTNTGSPQYFDESADPAISLFAATPVTNAAFAVGAREKFRQLTLSIYKAMTIAGNTFTWNVSNGAGGFIDKTAQVTEAIANSKQMRGATGEWKFSWPDFSDWLPQQYNTQGYQYWLLVLCTLGGTNGGSNVSHGRGRIRGDFLGRRTIVTQSEAGLEEWPGFTLPRQTVETFPTGLLVRRARAAVMNDYVYYACDGQRPLQRWNGNRLTCQSGASNAPADAGLTAPVALVPFVDLFESVLASAYPTGWTLRYRLVYEYGQGGVLGQSPPSPSTEIVIASIPAGAVTVDFQTMRNNANPTEVVAIRIYVTTNVTGQPLAQADDISGFSFIKRVERDDANWVSGNWEDQFAERSKTEPSPINYVNTPPFYPKYVATGGGRLWIADDFQVAWSDVGRGDSWDPTNTISFPSVTGIKWRDDKMFVWETDNLRAIEGVNVSSGLPEATYVLHGIGNVQPDSLTEGEDTFFFVSRRGPVSFTPGQGWRLMGSGRVYESTNYWNGKVGERPFSQGAFFERRWWIPVDSGGPNQYVGRVATYDLESPNGAWFRLRFLETVPQERVWAALAEIHAPLDVSYARDPILVGFPDANGTTEFNRLQRLQYGTTDHWTSVVTDGVRIFGQMDSRALPMKELQLWKEFRDAHFRYKMPGLSAGGLSVYLYQDQGAANSTSIVVTTFSAIPRDLKLHWTEAIGKGPYREVAPNIHLEAETDSGFDLYSWWTDAETEDFSQR